MTALSQGRSTAEAFTSAPQAIPFRAKVKKNHGKGTKVVNDVFRVSNYDDNYLGSASMATATTYSDNSVYSQIGTQVGVQNVAQTAERMGIETDLSTPGTDYSINDGPWEPYNPALILGGLSTGVTPLEMAHAYNTLQEDGNRISGSMAADSGGPVGILDVTDGGDCKVDCYQEGDPVADQTGASGVNKVISKPAVDPAVAETAKSVLSTVVSDGTGHLAQTGDPTWGKTGTTDDNGDAWFCGATPRITACIWVGYPDTVTPMETHFDGGAGRRRDLPGADLLPDRQRLRRPRGRPRPGRRGDTRESDSTSASTVPTDTATVPPATTTESAPAAPATSPPPPPPPAAPPAGGGGRHRRRRRRPRPAAASPPASGHAGAPRSGRDKKPLPAAQKRHGSSVALLIPIRGPVATSTSRHSAARARNSNGARSAARRCWLRPIAERLGELPGAGAELARARRRPRRARICSIPQRGSSARISTAAALPSRLGRRR